jgi:2-dehydro-3-deoxyphosphogluconate aldolase/(4S)-4-hydroxy-2-oxoglutarate aldolase
MTKVEVLEKVKQLGLLAVIRGPSAELTVKMVEALVAGGVLGIEVTYSTPDAEGVVRTLSGKFGDRIVLGMGTLTKPEQASAAKAAGANFIVSPVCEPTLVKTMVDSGLLTMAGAFTPRYCRRTTWVLMWLRYSPAHLEGRHMSRLSKVPSPISP